MPRDCPFLCYRGVEGSCCRIEVWTTGCCSTKRPSESEMNVRRWRSCVAFSVFAMVCSRASLPRCLRLHPRFPRRRSVHKQRVKRKIRPAKSKHDIQQTDHEKFAYGHSPFKQGEKMPREQHDATEEKLRILGSGSESEMKRVHAGGGVLLYCMRTGKNNHKT